MGPWTSRIQYIHPTGDQKCHGQTTLSVVTHHHMITDDAISHRREFTDLSHTSASSQPTRELLGVILFVISLLMCFAKYNFVAIWTVQAVKFIHITLFVTVFQLPKIWRINTQAFQAKPVPTDCIDMHESGSCDLCEENAPHDAITVQNEFYGDVEQSEYIPLPWWRRSRPDIENTTTHYTLDHFCSHADSVFYNIIVSISCWSHTPCGSVGPSDKQRNEGQILRPCFGLCRP
jgi:hypothetical protein